MNRLDAVPNEVLGIECENPANAMDIHRRYQLCIVDLGTQNVLLDHETLPFGIDRGGVSEERQKPLDFLRLAQGERDREAKTVVCGGAGFHIPEFRHIAFLTQALASLIDDKLLVNDDVL